MHPNHTKFIRLSLCAIVVCMLFYSTMSAQKLVPLQSTAEKIMKLNMPMVKRLDSLNVFLAKNYRNNYAETETISLQALAEAQKSGYVREQGLFLITLANTDEGLAHFSSAENRLNQAITLLTPGGESKALARAYISLGWLQRRFMKRGDAMSNSVKGLKIAENVKDSAQMTNAYTTIAALHLELGEYQKAIDYHLMGLAVRKKLGNPVQISMSYGNIGIVYNRMKKVGEALKYQLLALDAIKGVNDPARLAFVYNDLGAAYITKGDAPNAIKYLTQSIAIRERIGEMNELAYTQNYLGLAYDLQHNTALAEHWVRQALVTAIKIANTKQHSEALESVSDLYASHKKYDSAYVYLHKFKLYADSVRKIEKNNQMRELTVKYETEKKAQEIINLKQETALQHLQIRQRNISLVVAVVLIAAILLIGYLVYTRRKIQTEAALQLQKVQEQENLVREILNAEERERRRMGTDLHDGVGQLLSAALLSLNRLAKFNFNGDDETKLAAQSLELVTESYDEVRSISHQIIPNALLKYGLGAAIRDFLSKIDSQTIKVSLEIAGIDERLDEQTETVLYRVIQETVNNVIKHAAASKLNIQLIKDEEGIALTIEDNGKGFDIKTLETAGGIGMRNIYSRVSFLNGTVDVQSAQGKGTLIAIFIGK